MWCDCLCEISPQETKLTQKLTAMGHRTTFNNEQSPYRIKSPEITYVKHFKREN